MNRNKSIRAVQHTAFFTVVLLSSFTLSGCLWYMTHNRSKVLVEGVDIDQTLEIAEMELQRGGWGSVLTLWAIRDQRLTQRQAEMCSRLYMTYIDELERDFNVWHLTWAMANMYRLGDGEVKAALQAAYDDAIVRAQAVHRLADRHANHKKIYMGDTHIGGRRYAKKHVVAPGKKGYVQSVEEYKKNSSEKQ